MVEGELEGRIERRRLRRRSKALKGHKRLDENLYDRSRSNGC